MIERKPTPQFRGAEELRRGSRTRPVPTPKQQTRAQAERQWRRAEEEGR